MKKTALIIISLVILTILTIGSITFAFYYNKASQTTINIGTSNAAEISITVDSSEIKKIVVPSTSVDGSYDSLTDGNTMTYVPMSYISQSKRIMNFSILRISYENNNLSIEEIAYFNTLFEFNLLITTGLNDSEIIAQAPTTNWYTLADYTNPNADLVKTTPLDITQNTGHISLYVRIKKGISSELIPETLYSSSIKFYLSIT